MTPIHCSRLLVLALVLCAACSRRDSITATEAPGRRDTPPTPPSARLVPPQASVAGAPDQPEGAGGELIEQAGLGRLSVRYEFSSTGASTTPPRLLSVIGPSRRDLHVPALMRGVYIARVSISSAGGVSGVTTLRSFSPAIDRILATKIRAFMFAPATVEGSSVHSEAFVTWTPVSPCDWPGAPVVWSAPERPNPGMQRTRYARR